MEKSESVGVASSADELCQVLLGVFFPKDSRLPDGVRAAGHAPLSVNDPDYEALRLFFEEQFDTSERHPRDVCAFYVCRRYGLKFEMILIDCEEAGYWVALRMRTGEEVVRVVPARHLPHREIAKNFG